MIRVARIEGDAIAFTPGVYLDTGAAGRRLRTLAAGHVAVQREGARWVLRGMSPRTSPRLAQLAVAAMPASADDVPTTTARVVRPEVVRRAPKLETLPSPAPVPSATTAVALAPVPSPAPAEPPRPARAPKPPRLSLVDEARRERTDLELTLREKILVAAIGLDAEVLDVSNLVVACWKRWPSTFGLRGYEARHPDANRVQAKLAGDDGVVGLGWLARHAQGELVVTPKGRRVATAALRREPAEVAG